MNDKPRTRGRAATTRTQRSRAAGATTSRARGEESTTPPKKIARGRGTERASSLLRNRKARAEEDAAVEAQAASAPAEDPTEANLPETRASTLSAEPQPTEVTDRAAGEDKPVAEEPVSDAPVTLTLNDDNTVEADTETVSQEAGSAVAETATEAAKGIAQTMTRAKGTRKSSGAGSGAAAGRGETPKTRAAKTRMPKAEPVTGKRATAATPEVKAEPGTAAATRGRAARKRVDPAKDEAPVMVEAPKARRKQAAPKATNGATPVIDQPPGRPAPRKDTRKPRQMPVSTPAAATLVADSPMSALFAAAAKPWTDRAPAKRAEAMALGTAPDRIMRETMEIARIGFSANFETLQALISARTPAEVLEVQVRGMQMMADVWTRQAARIQDLYVTTIGGRFRG